MSLTPFQAAVGALWVLPVSALYIAPPAEMIVERNSARGRAEHCGTGHQVFGRHAWKILGLGRVFGHRHIACRLHKPSELFIGDRGLVHPETVHGNLVCRLGVLHLW